MMRRTVSIVAVLLATAMIGKAQSMFELTSAQIVTSTDRPPVLKLIATGPIAFRQLTAADGNPSSAANQVVVVLYGMRTGQNFSSDAIYPFTIQQQPTDGGVRLTITIAELPPGLAPVVRLGSRTSDLEIALVRAE